ncbi:NUDIX domain-containing protein [Pseudotabrizicola algicola]|uniref:ADP-ribose pyrophosphatase n=1 Tax=Pseudotabrizicola algicola TaxID=2709381 RepID=A0A6B3RQZ8_9RHOB|nr:NUDIX domain-containing protein [Pseudotabrizicola algicola]NEX45522.1 NUDIX domain-containing protein [Pseudotabrizicola algicola]
MSQLFLCGPLCHRPLLDVILGSGAALLPAVAADREGVAVDAPGAFALRRRRGQAVEGAVLEGASAEAHARLAFYARALGLAPQRLRVGTAAGSVAALAYALRPAPDDRDPWQPALWLAGHAELARETAAEVMAEYGRLAPARLQARLGSIMVRAASRLRARTASAPHSLRRPPAEVEVVARRQPYAHFFAVEEYDLSFRRFDGSMSAVVTRAAFVSTDAVTVLPYDPQRDRVLLVEQWRAGPFARGDGNPWQLEAIAGRIDAGETPEETARREAEEEAGLTLGPLRRVAEYYPSPGAKTEFLYSYVAQADLPDGTGGVFGVADEAEDIRTHIVSLDQALALVESGEIANAPLALSLLWLARERERFRAPS